MNGEERTVGYMRPSKTGNHETNDHLGPDKSMAVTSKSLIVPNPWLTLNQRVPGSSPGAPTKQKIPFCQWLRGIRAGNKTSFVRRVVEYGAAGLLRDFSLFLFLHPIRYSSQTRWYRSITCSS